MVDSIRVTNSLDRHRYEIAIDDEVVGHADYRMGEASVVFSGTEVDPNLSGRGLGSALIRFALDDVRARWPGLGVVPQCPFVARFVEIRPEYRDLLRPEEPSVD